MAPPLILRIIGDASSYFKTAEATIATNTQIGKSALATGASFEKSAAAQVAAGEKSIAVQRAQLVQLQRIQTVAVAGSDRRIAADVAVANAQAKLNRSLGLTAMATGRAGEGARTAERDLGKMTRGALAGSGVFAALGRSLAFASGGFLAVAGGATLLEQSIRAAQELAATQRQVEAQLKTSGKTWDEYGKRINATDLKISHVSGFTNQDLLQSFGYLVRVTGNVSEALKLNGVAADVARGRHIALSSASIALSKALGGSTTALKRLGITIPPNLSRMQALTYVQQKFAGQAEAGATVSDRFHASLVDTEEIVGTALLPAFERLTTGLSNWLAKMNETGRLQKDVNDVVTTAGGVFHTLGEAIGTVDKITGSFATTLKLIGEIWIGLKIAGWIKSLQLLAVEWGVVGASANAAAAAEGRAAATAGAGAGTGALLAGAEAGAGVGVLGGLLGRRSSTLPATGVEEVGTAATVAETKVASLRSSLLGLGTLTIAPIAIPLLIQIQHSKQYRDAQNKLGPLGFLGDNLIHVFQDVNDKALKALYVLSGGHLPGTVNPNVAQAVTTLGTPRLPTPGGARFAVPADSQAGIAQWTAYQLTLTEQILQARAALTKTTKDDVAIAKQIVARIKRKIAEGALAPKALLEALQAEAAALGTIQAAADAAKAKAQAQAAARLAAASTYSVPGYLQLAQAKADAYGKDQTTILKKIIAAAEKAIHSGKKNWQGLVAAYQVIASAQAQLNQQAQNYTLPLKLQLQLARAQATNGDQTPILLRMRAALYKALKAAKGNIQKQIDIWNQIAGINSQLQNSVTDAYGKYKKASLKAETAGLGLTAAQRRALEERLSQRGPGGTVPSTGTGAGGYIIDPATGRPVDRHRRRRHPGYRTDASMAGGGSAPVFKEQITIVLNIDGKKVTEVVTRRQQRYCRSNPQSRRGPHAATATA